MPYILFQFFLGEKNFAQKFSKEMYVKLYSRILQHSQVLKL